MVEVLEGGEEGFDGLGPLLDRGAESESDICEERGGWLVGVFILRQTSIHLPHAGGREGGETCNSRSHLCAAAAQLGLPSGPRRQAPRS